MSVEMTRAAIREAEQARDRDALADLYVDCIGYDPFEDDPTATVESVAHILRGWCDETQGLEQEDGTE